MNDALPFIVVVVQPTTDYDDLFNHFVKSTYKFEIRNKSLECLNSFMT